MKYVLLVVIGCALIILSYLLITHQLPTYLYVGPEGKNPPKQEPVVNTKIEVTSPKEGDKLEIGKEFPISFQNYQGTEPLMIVLKETTEKGIVIAKPIAHQIPATSTSFMWRVTSEQASSTYTIEVYPVGSRERVGISAPFTISGIPLVYDLSIKSTQVLDVSKPVVVTGLVKDSTQFTASVSYDRDGRKEEFFITSARCVNDCKKVYGSYRPFEITLDLQNSAACYVIVELFKNKETIPFYSFPMSLSGIPRCP